MALPVKLTWTRADGYTAEEDFALLVVACDPRSIKIEKTTAFEEDVKNSLSSNTFNTSLFEVKREAIAPFASRFCPEYLENNGPDAESHMYIFRDEVRAHNNDWPTAKPPPGTEYEAPGSAGGKSLVMCYQLRYAPYLVEHPEEVEKSLNATLNDDLYRKKLEWVDFTVPLKSGGQGGYEVNRLEMLITDYFPHFNSENLARGMPWKILENQGKNNTIYVSSFTCFESVIHCYEYGQMLMQQPQVQAVLPKDLNAPIAVVGGGPSGLLFATQQLMRGKGYTNIKIIEATQLLGGKTATVQRISPGDPSILVPCELGTCYLSSEYTPLSQLMDEYQAGTPFNLERNADVAPPFRGVIDPDLARDEDELKNGIDFPIWVLRVAAAADGKHDAVVAQTAEKIAKEPASLSSSFDKLLVPVSQRGETAAGVDFSVIWGIGLSYVKYQQLHTQIMGDSKPMPLTPLKETDDFRYSWTIKDFLEHHKLLNLRGLFAYGYSVQGYSDISTVPAYYGLVWLTPKVILGALISTVWTKIPPVWQGLIKALIRYDPDTELMGIFAMERGWQAFWDRIAYKHELLTTPGRTELNAKNVVVKQREVSRQLDDKPPAKRTKLGNLPTDVRNGILL